MPAKLKSILDNLDNVPVELHDLYEEKDGKFYLLLDDDVKTHPLITALSNAYQQVKKKLQDTKADFDKLKLRLTGIPDEFDAAAYEELVAKAEAAGEGTVDEKVRACREGMQKKLDDANAKHTTDLAAKDAEIARLGGSIERNVIDGGLTAALEEANIDPKHRKKLAPYLRSLGKIKVVDDDGVPTAMVETAMGEVTISKFVSDWAGTDDGKEYVRQPTGLDTNGSDGRRLEGNPFAAANWNKTEQGKIIRTNRAKAEQLAKAAGFKTIDAALSARAAISK